MTLCKLVHWFDNELDDLFKNSFKQFEHYMDVNPTINTISMGLCSNKELISILLWNSYESY